LGYNFEHSQRNNFIVIKKSENGGITQTFETYDNLTENNIYFNFPVPLTFFKNIFKKTSPANNYLFVGGSYLFYNINPNGKFTP
jgi:hypothetical protein